MERRRRKPANETMVRGSTNVFADLGYPDAEERQTKLRLAFALNQLIDDRKLTQIAAANLLGVNQPKISALLNYKLEGFSVERLMTLLTALDHDVDIVIKKKPRSQASGRINVIAASMKRARGMMESRVSDLASNPKHLVGFGRNDGSHR